MENGWSARFCHHSKDIILTDNSFVLEYFVEAVVAGELELNNFVKSDFVDFEKFQQEEAISMVHYKNPQQEIFFVFVMGMMSMTMNQVMILCSDWSVVQ